MNAAMLDRIISDVSASSSPRDPGNDGWQAALTTLREVLAERRVTEMADDLAFVEALALVEKTRNALADAKAENAAKDARIAMLAEAMAELIGAVSEVEPYYQNARAVLAGNE